MATKRKRLVRGKDWHAWAWKPHALDAAIGPFLWFAKSDRPKRDHPLGDARRHGKWVRVKFVEVK